MASQRPIRRRPAATTSSRRVVTGIPDHARAAEQRQANLQLILCHAN